MKMIITAHDPGDEHMGKYLDIDVLEEELTELASSEMMDKRDTKRRKENRRKSSRRKTAGDRRK